MRKIYALKPKKPQILPSATVAMERFEAMIRERWKPQTIENRRNTWSRMALWCSTEGLNPSGESAALWLCVLEIAAGTRKSYASQLQAVGQELLENWDPQPLQVVSRSAGPSWPEAQATPVTLEQVETLFHLFLGSGLTLHAATLTCLWKGILRHADLATITKEMIVSTNPEETILDGASTKRLPKDSDVRFIILRGGVMIRFLNSFLTQNPLPPSGPVIPLTGTQFIKEVKKHFPLLSLHSFRRGALQRLLALSVRGYSISSETLRRAARHKSPNPTLPPNTARYLAECRLEMALHLDPQVSQLL